MKTLRTCAFCLWFFVLTALAEEVTKFKRLQTVDGRTFENVVVTAVLENAIRITHEDGAATLKFSNLPPDVAKTFEPEATKDQKPATTEPVQPPSQKSSSNEASAPAKPSALNAQDPKTGEANLKQLLATLKASQSQRLLTQEEVQIVVGLLQAISALPVLKPDGSVLDSKGFPDSEAITTAKAYGWAVPYRGPLSEIVDVELQHLAAAVTKQNANAVAPQPINETAMLVQALRGASIVAQDGRNTFLGTIDSEFAVNSILNKVSLYGSEFGINSVFNKFGLYGSEFGLHSANNEFSIKPPMIVKGGKLLGYLTANRFVPGGISLSSLLSLKKAF